MPSINFFAEEIPFKIKNQKKRKLWLRNCILKESYKLDMLNYIFCSDEYLLQINRQYLEHDYYTDIITFDNSEIPKTVCGDLFISIDRITENAKSYDTDFENELNRVMIHGLLHLLAYDDKSPEDKKKMREMEDFYLQKLN